MPYEMKVLSILQKFKSHGMYATLSDVTEGDSFLILNLEYTMNLIDEWEAKTKDK